MDFATKHSLTAQEASDAVGRLGWRLVLGSLRAWVPVTSLSQASRVAADAVAACDEDADHHLLVDLRAERVAFTLQTLDQVTVTARDIELARRITDAVSTAGLRTEPEFGTDGPADVGRSVQVLEIGIDAMDIPAIRPFWKAILGYADEVRAGAPVDPDDPLVDPIAQGPAIWFQQMDEPRNERNRLHFDISVPHDEAPRRIKAALAAGGRLLTAEHAPAFWVLADPEGNEACVTTWQGRD